MRSNHQTLTSILTGTLTFTYPTTSSWRGLFRRVVFVLLAFAWSAGAWAYSGTGTEGDPYVISGANVNTNWTDLKTVMALGGYIRLDANCTDGTKNSTSYLEVPNGKTVTLNLNGKTINRNLGSAIENGYVIKNLGTLTINGSGTITGGKNTSEGGGIYTNSGSLYINGGNITGNSSTEGGGIYYLSGYLYINGGSITANSVTSNGGGIYNRAYNMSVSGNCTIKDNLKGTNQNNVYLETSNSYIRITGNLASETRIGVTTGGAVPIKIVDNRKATSPYDHRFDISTSNFTSDNTSNVVALTNDGYAYLSKKYIDDSPNDRTIVLEIPLHSGSEWTNVELMGKGTSANPYQIGSVKEWEAFATIVNADDGKLDACAILTADITFTGNHQQPGEDEDFSFANCGGQRYYRGTFDGRGHTITLKLGKMGGINNKSTWGGLFWHTRSATIQNLKVAGEIRTANPECGTIVQHAGNVQIINCESTVKIVCEATSEGNRAYVGGFLGTHYNVNESPNSLFKNCFFHGEFSAVNSNYSCKFSGGFVGGRNFAHDKITIQNSYSFPALIYETYVNMYSFGINIPEPTHSFYNFSIRSSALDSSGGQGTDASTMTATNIESGLNTLESGTQDAWVAHNDTIYLKTFAKYVDISGWTYGSPNNPTVVGNNGEATVTYKYKAQGADDATYTTTKPTDVGDYTVLAIVPANNGWNGWTSTMNFTIAKKDVTVSNITASNKTYDGNTTATIVTGNASFSGLLAGDALTVSTSGTFDNANVGTGKTVTFGTLTLGGTSIGNYQLAASGQQTTTTADITQKALTVTANNHSITYGDAPANNGVEYSGFVNEETSTVLGGTLAYAYNYTQKGNVGSYTITPSGLTSSNYDISFVPGTLTVAKKDVTVSGITASNKTYDGNTTATIITGNASFSELLEGDALTVSTSGTFDNANVGTGKTVTFGTLTLGGTSIGNYQLAASGQQTTTTADITQKALTVTANNHSIIYGDIPDNNGVSYSGFVNSETSAVLGGTLAYAYSYEQYGDVGNTYTIIPSGLTSSNYDISFVAGTLEVGQKEVGLTWSTPTTFTYDGEKHAPTATATGLVNSDEIGVTVTGAQTNANASAYTATASALTGTKSGNYKLPTANTQTFTITPKAITADLLNAKISLSSTSFEYTGKAQAPTVTITGMTEGTDYTGKYKKGNSEATSEKPKEAGTYAIVIVGKGNYSGEVVTSKTFTIEEPLPEIVDSSKPVTVGGETFYELTSGIKESIGSTIQADIVLPAVADTRTTVTSEGALSFSKGADIMMAVRNLKLSDIVTFIFTGNLYGDSSRLRQKGAAARGTRGDSALKLASGVAYEVISAGDMIVSLKLGEEESTIKSINVKASATGINAVEAEKGEDLWFDLSGRRIDKPTKKGIYIKNGQKVVFDSAH